MLKIAPIALALLTVGLTPALASQPSKVAADPIAGLAAEEQLVADIQQHAENDDEKPMRQLLETAVAAPAFAQLSSRVQHWLYDLLGEAAVDAGDNREALVYAKKAVAMDEATAADWKLMVKAAHGLDDAVTEADGILAIAHGWPTMLDYYRDRYYPNLCERLMKAKDRVRRAALLNALSDANWRPQGHIENFSILWVWLAEVRLDAGDLVSARAAAEKVTSDNAVLEMMNDKRFDPVTSADPQRFDPVAVANRELLRLQQASAAQPDLIEGPFLIAVQLMTLGRNDDALAVVDSALKKALPGDGAKTPFTDINDYLIWVMDTRSRLLGRFGRYDDAIAQERQVAQYAEDGALNVSQLLNLGDMLQKLGRPNEALEAVKGAEVRHMSPYGRMVLMQIRVCAEEQGHDAKSSREVLAVMRTHATDGRAPLRDALLCIDDEGGVAGELIHDLADPDARAGALSKMQTFAPRAGRTDNERMLDARFDAIKMRPDVQAAARAVGHLRSYPLNAPLN